MVSNSFSPKGKGRITQVLPLYSLSAIHYKVTNKISCLVKLLLCVTKCRHIRVHMIVCNIFRVRYGYGANATLENITVIMSGSVLLGEVARVSREIDRPVASH